MGLRGERARPLAPVLPCVQSHAMGATAVPPARLILRHERPVTRMGTSTIETVRAYAPNTLDDDSACGDRNDRTAHQCSADTREIGALHACSSASKV